MNQLVTIIKLTIKESIRSGYVRTLCFLTVANILFFTFFADIILGSYQKVLCTGAFFNYQITVIATIFFYLIPRYTTQERYQFFGLLLMTPLSHTTLIYGIYIGHVMLIILAGFSYYVIWLLLLKLLTGAWFWHLWLAFVAITIEACFLLSAALFFVIRFSHTPVFAYLGVIATSIIGYTTRSAQQIPTLIHCMLPDLSLLDIKLHVIYQVPFPLTTFITACGCTIAWSLLFLLIAHHHFKNKPLIF